MALIRGAYGKRGLEHFWSRTVLAPVLLEEGIFYKLERYKLVGVIKIVAKLCHSA